MRALSEGLVSRRRSWRRLAVSMLLVVLGADQVGASEPVDMGARAPVVHKASSRTPGEMRLRGLWVASATYAPGDLVFTTHQSDGRYRLCYFIATSTGSPEVVNQDIAPVVSSNPTDAGAYWYAFDPGCADTQRVLAEVAVPGAAAPWDRRINPAMKAQYDHDVDAPPRIVPLAPLGLQAGDSVAIQCVGGRANGGGLPDTGCLGLTQFPPANDVLYTQVCGQPGTTACRSVAPSKFIDPASYPVYLMQVIGAFADQTGVVVGTPFVVTRTRRTVTVPKGASQLLLGFNDTLYGPGNGGGPNTGALLVKLTAAD